MRRAARGCLTFTLLAVSGAACSKGPERSERHQVVATSIASTREPRAPQGPPALLYIPDASPPELLPGPAPARPVLRGGPCSPDMVLVQNAFCIDRYEVSLVDAVTGKRLSPYYHPTRDATLREYSRWSSRKEGTELGRTMAVPAPPEWELKATRFEPMAQSIPSTEPNGYLSGEIAETACRRAGKRLCTPEEWVVSCRGRQNRQFPYGQTYEEGRCNVFRESHPAELLHGDASEGHLDPRLNLVKEPSGEPLLRRTGETSTCRSEWGNDAASDMVGNLDEWVADPGGTFVGGFYSRATNRGCDARVEVHDYGYYDYSLGTRCCKSL